MRAHKCSEQPAESRSRLSRSPFMVYSSWYRTHFGRYGIEIPVNSSMAQLAHILPPSAAVSILARGQAVLLLLLLPLCSCLHSLHCNSLSGYMMANGWNSRPNGNNFHTFTTLTAETGRHKAQLFRISVCVCSRAFVECAQFP